MKRAKKWIGFGWNIFCGSNSGARLGIILAFGIKKADSQAYDNCD